MVYLSFIFFCFVILFAIIGAMRGWAKEMMVTASAVLGLFIITVLETYVQGINDTFATPGSPEQFGMRVAIIVILTFFGYQTPNLPRIGGQRFARERFQDSFLGIFLGALNGYLIVGSIWYFLARYLSASGYVRCSCSIMKLNYHPYLLFSKSQASFDWRMWIRLLWFRSDGESLAR